MADTKHHPDFDRPWCKAVLASNMTGVFYDTPPVVGDASKSLFNETLFTHTGIRAYLRFRRSTTESSMPDALESCILMSLGTGLEGTRGRAHGGLTALLLDEVTSAAVLAEASSTAAPSTANLNVDYKRPIDTPTVVLCRSWVTEFAGRKITVKATIEDGKGGVYATGTALYIFPRGSML